MGDLTLDYREVAEKLVEARGVISVAARQLGVTRSTVYNYCKRFKSCADAVEEGRKVGCDVALASITSLTGSSYRNHKDHFLACKWYLEKFSPLVADKDEATTKLFESLDAVLQAVLEILVERYGREETTAVWREIDRVLPQASLEQTASAKA